MKNALRLFSQDRTGLADYALESGGQKQNITVCLFEFLEYNNTVVITVAFVGLISAFDAQWVTETRGHECVINHIIYHLPRKKGKNIYEIQIYHLTELSLMSQTWFHC